MTHLSLFEKYAYKKFDNKFPFREKKSKKGICCQIFYMHIFQKATGGSIGIPPPPLPIKDMSPKNPFDALPEFHHFYISKQIKMDGTVLLSHELSNGRDKLFLVGSPTNKTYINSRNRFFFRKGIYKFSIN